MGKSKKNRAIVRKNKPGKEEIVEDVTETLHKHSTPSAFDSNNSMISAAMASLSTEQKEMYKAIGEKMYDFDYENGGLDGQMSESAAYIFEQVKSGLSPDALEYNELEILRQVMGEEWYEPLGYTKDDIPAKIDE